MTPGIIETMSAEKFEAFLKERGRTAETIKQMEDSLVAHTKAYLQSTNQRTDDVFVERAVSMMRAKVTKIITDSGDNGIPWELIEKSLQ